MEILITLITTICAIILLSIIFKSYKINKKEIEQIALDEKLNKLTEKYPSNIEICREILKKLNNENVEIEENSESDTSLYIAITNKISIANVRKSFTRIQTIAHECLHSIQDRRVLLFNFIYSNIYLIYFAVSIILTILKKIPNEEIFLNILLILGFIYYIVRSYLENDAMIKARYLAEEYLKEKDILSEEEIKSIVEGYDKINNVGIKYTNYSIAISTLVKVVILGILMLIF